MKPSRVVLILVLVLAVGCTTIITEMNYDYDSSVDFASLKTYGWLPGQKSSTEFELILKRFEQEVDAQLQAKGFRRASSNPDFHVGLQGSSRTKVYRSRSSRNYYSEPFTYKEGTVTLDFFDAKTGEPIWHAKGVGEGSGSATPEQRSKTANKVVARMLKNFPPPQ
jgi:hypothetical protein